MKGLRVFLSWSGPRSHAVASALYEWLPTVLQSTEPRMSSEDIRKGQRWGAEISRELEESNVGIFCLTPENLTAPWILFEAGALAKHADDARVNCFLVGLRKLHLSPPLSLYQATEAEKEDVRRFVTSINDAAAEHRIAPERCDTAFERGWADLERALKEPAIQAPPSGSTPPRRDEREVLEEILGRLSRVESILADRGEPGALAGSYTRRDFREDLDTVDRIPVHVAEGEAVRPLSRLELESAAQRLDEVEPARIDTLLTQLPLVHREVFQATFGWPRDGKRPMESLPSMAQRLGISVRTAAMLQRRVYVLMFAQ